MKKEKFLREYFDGWEKKDWNAVSSMLADGFNFTSPNNDDHINIEKFKLKCWPEAEKIEKYTFEKVLENEDEAFLMYSFLTKDGQTIRETNHVTFSNGKMKTMEVFFGTGHDFHAEFK